MNMRKVTRTALTAPLLVVGGFLALTLSSATVFAASSSTNGVTQLSATANTPQTSSKPHKHERVECSPGRVAENHGQCAVTFVDPATKGEPHPQGQKVCFSVSPKDAGKIGTGAGSCARINSNDKALGTFTASGNYCGKATISATEIAEHEQPHHTTITIVCKTKDATTTAAIIPAGNPLPPSGGGWLLGVMGVGAAILTGYALRTRRWFAPGRLAAGQSA